MRPVREQLENRCERSRLRDYVEQVFLRQLDHRGASKSHIERHSAALEYVERFVKSPLSPEDVDEQLILNFEAWLWRQGVSDGRRRDLVESLTRIARSWKPGPTRLVKKCQRRPIPDPPERSLFHFYENTYLPLHLVGRTADYIDANRAVFRRLYEHFGRHILLAEQTDALAADHFDWLLQRGLRPATINTGSRAVWFAVWRCAYSLDLVGRLPTLRALPTNQEPPDAWSLEELQRFIDCCHVASTKPIGGLDAGDLWEALVRVLWYTGLRRRSVLAIRRVDVNIETGWLRVPGSSMKNRRGGQWRLGIDALEAITRIWQPERELLFPFTINKTTFYKQFHRIREAADLPKSSSNAGCLHLIRRSTATEAARQHGIGAAQTILGHSSPAVTRRYLDESKLPGHDFTKVLRPLRQRTAEAG